MHGPSFLDRLTSADREILEHASNRRQYRRGAVIFLDGDDAREVLIIESGELKITLASQDGREIMIDIRGAGEIVGEMSLIDDSPRSASAFALSSPTDVFVLSVRDFKELLDTHPTFARTLLDEMVQKVRDATFQQLELSLDDVLGRVCRRIVIMSDRFGVVESDGSIQLKSPITQQDLADWAGVSRQAVVKALAELREHGLIATKGSTMHLIGPEDIRARAAQLSGLA